MSIVSGREAATIKRRGGKIFAVQGTAPAFGPALMFLGLFLGNSRSRAMGNRAAMVSTTRMDRACAAIRRRPQPDFCAAKKFQRSP